MNFLTRTTPEAFKKTDEIEKNVRQQLLPSITGKNHITDEDRSLFAEWEDETFSVTRTFSEIMSGHEPFVIH